MQVVFMGSPEFALPTLSSLDDEHHVRAVVCQPDRRAGRGRKLRPPPTKRFAIDREIPVLQPQRVAEPSVIEQLADYHPELIIVAAYGQILPKILLDIPSVGSLNVHASLLPRWRGASPIQAAILHGDQQTGITIMEMDAGLDTGPTLSQARVSIKPEESGVSLSYKLARVGATLLIKTLPDYAAGKIPPIAQDDSQATFAPLLRKADGALDFTQSAIELERKIRAYHPWPGTFLTWSDRQFAVKAASCGSDAFAPPGVVYRHDGSPAVGTPDGALVLDQIQPPGKREMSGAAFLNGSPGFVGANLLA
jgi:methionyl-tRNA formyltransferase